MAATAAAKPEPERRRISNARANTALDSMVEDETRGEIEISLKWAHEQCKASPRVLQLCKTAISEHLKATHDQTTLKRGFRTLLSTPDYVVRAALARMTGLDESVVRSMPTDEYRCLWYWGMRGTPSLRLPAKEMMSCEFMAWVDRLHEQGGYRIRGVRLAAEEQMNWELELGEVNFVKPSSQDPAAPVTHIIHRPTNVTKPINPAWGVIKLGDLGVTHHIIGNYSLYDAQLKVGGTTHDLYYFFNNGSQQAGHA